MDTTQSIMISLALANKIIDALDDMTSISERRRIHYELCDIVENATSAHLTPVTMESNEEVRLLREENAALRREMLICSRIDRECEN